jgi:hypothetical protein
VNELDQLRHTIASEHGLSPTAAKLLSGTSVSELEASADALERLLADYDARAQETEPAATNLLTAARAKQQERKRRLHALLTGHPEQPRDARGRYAARGGGFDGGAARQTPALPRDAAREHDMAVVEHAARSKRGRSDF